MLKKNIIIIAVTGVISIIACTSCGNENKDDRKIINKADKQIIILENKKPTANSEVALDKIDMLTDIRALDWIDEKTLLITKENEQYPKIQLDSGEAYPKNLYEYDIDTKKIKLISGTETDMGYAVLSPDKKHIFYKEGIEDNLTGFILDRSTGRKVQVTNKDSISANEGKWIDNNTVIFSEFPQGGIYTVDVNGKVQAIENQPKGMVSNVAKLGEKIFYTLINGKLYSQNIDGTEKKLLKDNVLWVIPSENEQQLLIVKRTESTRMTLVLTDLEGNEKKTLSEGVQIFGTNWSPDQTKAAYSVSSDTSGKAGMFVSDINSGKTAQLTLNIELPADEVRWSNSEKELLATNVSMENNKPHFITYILKLK